LVNSIVCSKEAYQKMTGFGFDRGGRFGFLAFLLLSFEPKHEWTVSTCKGPKWWLFDLTLRCLALIGEVLLTDTSRLSDEL
jgi:hypothetical protein